jgi:predicted metalloprotease
MWGADEDVFVYFNNDHGGCAVRDAHRFALALDKVGLVATRVPGAREGEVMTGHQEFKSLSADEVRRAATQVAEMQKWAREAYLSTKHVEDVEDIWVRYFEAEHHLHWIVPPATEPEEDG